MTSKKTQIQGMSNIAYDIIFALLIGFSFYIFSLALSQFSSSDIPEQLFYAIGSTGSTLCATLYLLRKHPTSFSLGKIRTNKKNIVKWGIFGGIAISVLQFPYATIYGGQEIRAKLFIPFDEGIEHIAILLVFSIIITPIVEEIFFRACIYKILKNRFNNTIGYIGTALLFTMMHTASFFRALLFMLSSIILTYIYEKIGLIEVSIVAHSIWNAAWFSAMYAYHLSSSL